MGMSQSAASAKKAAIIMLGEYKADIWMIPPAGDPLYRWTVQRIRSERILHSGEEESLEEAEREARACLDRLAA